MRNEQIAKQRPQIVNRCYEPDHGLRRVVQRLFKTRVHVYRAHDTDVVSLIRCKHFSVMSEGEAIYPQARDARPKNVLTASSRAVELRSKAVFHGVCMFAIARETRWRYE